MSRLMGAVRNGWNCRKCKGMAGGVNHHLPESGGWWFFVYERLYDLIILNRNNNLINHNKISPFPIFLQLSIRYSKTQSEDKGGTYNEKKVGRCADVCLARSGSFGRLCRSITFRYQTCIHCEL